MTALRVIGGVLGGAAMGAAIGIGVAAGLGALSQWQHPEDPSAASVAIVVIGTAPLGLMIGAIAGGSWAWRRRVTSAV